MVCPLEGRPSDRKETPTIRLRLYKVGGGRNHREILRYKMLSRWPERHFSTVSEALLFNLFSHVPAHSTREVVVVFGALISSDAGDIHRTITSLVEDKVRVRVVGLAAQVAVCRELCRRTNAGDECRRPVSSSTYIPATYGVVLNEQHFRELLFEVTTPPATHANKSTGSTLITMGFPSRAVEDHPSLCAWYPARYQLD